MNKPNMLGFLFLIGGGTIFLFKLIAELMNQGYKSAFLKDLIGTGWISDIPWGPLQDMAEFLVNLTFSSILLIFGILFITAGTFKRL